jgi:hypothetical protein
MLEVLQSKVGRQLPQHVMQQLAANNSFYLATYGGGGSGSSSNNSGNESNNKSSRSYYGRASNSRSGTEQNHSNNTGGTASYCPGFYDINNTDYRIINSHEILEVLSTVPLQSNVEYFDVSVGTIMFAGLGMNERVESAKLLSC